MDKLQEALDRAFPILQMGGLSGAMYPADEGEGQGWAISNEDWGVVAGAIRELIDDPVAVVRRGVESGTIKGKELGWCDTHNQRANMVIEKPACYHRLGCRVSQRLVLPVSDGGSET